MGIQGGTGCSRPNLCPSSGVWAPSPLPGAPAAVEMPLVPPSTDAQGPGPLPDLLTPMPQPHDPPISFLCVGPANRLPSFPNGDLPVCLCTPRGAVSALSGSARLLSERSAQGVSPESSPPF